MRRTATPVEATIRATICDTCSIVRNEAVYLDECVTDRPDVVVTTSSGKRIGIEITRLAYESYMRWLSKGTPMGKRREATLEVNLDLQLKDVLKKKNKRYHEYKRLNKLDQVWLCLHNDLYEPSIPPNPAQIDLAWFRAAAGFYCRKHDCKFDYVLFYSENSKQYMTAFDKRARQSYPNPGPLNPTIEFVSMTGLLTKDGVLFDESYGLVDKRRFPES